MLEKTSRGLGCDHWPPQELKALPPNAIASLTCLFRECESLVAIPAQIMLNIMCLAFEVILVLIIAT